MELINNYQVPEGYKKTEIGVIPEDWELKTIGDIGSVSSGGTPSRTNPLYWNGSIPWITTTQIDFNIIDNAEQFITQDGLNNSAANLLPPGTLLMAMYGQGKTRGKVAILNIKASINQACAAILLNNNINHKYIFYYLANQYEYIRNLSNIGNQENLNGLIIKSIKIPLPPLPEQKAIAQTLSDVDALIDALDKLIAKKRHIKTATMQQLLTGKTRLPGFGEGKGYKKSAIGVIPEDWDVKTYEDIFWFLKTASNSRADLSLNEDIKYIHYGDIHTKWQHKIDLQSEFLPSISQEKVKSIPFLEEGDIVMADASEDYEGIGKSIEVVNIGNIKVVAGLHTFLLRDSKKTFVDGFRGYLHTIKSVKLSIDKMATGLKVYGLSKNSLKNIYVPIPDKEEQKAIAQVLSDIDKEITALEKRRAKTQAIKQGMMQELLTGRTRLKFEHPDDPITKNSNG